MAMPPMPEAKSRHDKPLDAKSQAIVDDIVKLAQIAMSADQTPFSVYSWPRGQGQQVEQASGTRAVISQDVIFTELLRAYLRSSDKMGELSGRSC